MHTGGTSIHLLTQAVILSLRHRILLTLSDSELHYRGRSYSGIKLSTPRFHLTGREDINLTPFVHTRYGPTALNGPMVIQVSHKRLFVTG